MSAKLMASRARMRADFNDSREWFVWRGVRNPWTTLPAPVPHVAQSMFMPVDYGWEVAGRPDAESADRYWLSDRGEAWDRLTNTVKHEVSAQTSVAPSQIVVIRRGNAATFSCWDDGHVSSNCLLTPPIFHLCTVDNRKVWIQPSDGNPGTLYIIKTFGRARSEREFNRDRNERAEDELTWWAWDSSRGEIFEKFNDHVQVALDAFLQNGKPDRRFIAEAAAP